MPREAAPPIDKTLDGEGEVKPEAQAWLRQHERSNLFALRLLVGFTLLLGRRAGRVLLHPITAYFLVSGPRARRASRTYLARVLGRPAGWADLYRHFYTFAAVSLDRLFLLRERFAPFDVRVHGEDVLLEAETKGEGRLMLGGHLGSFEAPRVLGRQKPVTVNLVMYEENARRIASVTKVLDPELLERIIPLGRFDSMLRVADCLDRGEWVGVLADRSLSEGPRHRTAFLGQQAHFALAPFRMAAMLKHTVVFMVGVYRGGNRYDLHFEKLIDAEEFRRRDRDAALCEWVERYVSRLEYYCRLAPYNWFNFFDFWEEQTET